MLLFGGSAGLNKGNRIVTLEDSAAGSGWAFARLDATHSYAESVGVTRAVRHLVHLKKRGSEDYVVVYDSAAVSKATTIAQNLHFDKTKGQASGVATGATEFVWTGPNRRLSTTVVLPVASEVASTYLERPNAHRVSLCASSDGSTCAAVKAAEFLLVHKPAATTRDTMPPATAIVTRDDTLAGVEIKDPNAPSVAVFVKPGSADGPLTFTTTHRATARYVLVGVNAGGYDVARDGSRVTQPESSDGALSFESIAGTFTIRPSTRRP